MDSFPLSLENIKKWCEANNVPFAINEQLGQLAILRIYGRQIPIRFIPHDDRNMLTMAVVAPFKVPESSFEQVSNAIRLANSGTFMGAWMLHSKKGELYFRLTLPTLGLTITEETLKFLIQILLGTVQSVAPSLQKVALEGADYKIVLPNA